MRRLLIVYNPRSSRFVDVEKEVLSKARDLKGYMIGKYEVEPTDVDKNAAKFAKLIKDGDLVLAAGGDATGIIASNGIIKSGKDATLAVLPYGNFNDLSRTLGTKKFEDIFKNPTKKIYPLEIYVDGKFFRYASCYVTIGMTAEACELFDEPKFRKEMQKGHKSSWRSYLALCKWYFKNRHKRVFIPPFTINGKPGEKKASDYCALSGKSMCRVMKGGDDYLKPKVFRSMNRKLTSFPRLFVLMAKSILVRTPGKDTTGDKLEFLKPATVELQAEGEYRVFKDIKKIEIKKGDKCLKVIHAYSKLFRICAPTGQAKSNQNGKSASPNIQAFLKVVEDFTISATKNHRFIRIAGLSGSGKTTQILPAVEAYCRKNNFEPILMAARRFVEYHPHYQEIKEFYGDENLRKMTDEFATIMLFLTLSELIKGGYDVVLDVTLLDPEMEGILLELLKAGNYEALILMIAISPTVTEKYLSGRAWRHSRETELEFIRATSRALEFYATNAPELRIILWSVYDKPPVYDGEIKNCLEIFNEYSNREELPAADDDARRDAKIKYLTTDLD